VSGPELLEVLSRELEHTGAVYSDGLTLQERINVSFSSFGLQWTLVGFVLLGAEHQYQKTKVRL
jgi:hypothetical protein